MVKKIKAKTSYTDSDLNEEYTEYDYDKKYSNGWLAHHTQYDSIGKIMSETDYKKGTATMVFKQYTGNNEVEANYLNYVRKESLTIF